MPGSDRYIILKEIASGSTATVYLAEDKVLRRKVALKCLHPHLHSHADMVGRFAKEAVAIAALSHENIIKVFEFGGRERDFFLAMEYVEGTTLEAMLAAPGSIGRLPSLAAFSLFRQLLEGIAAAHAKGIFHRDIKPSNVLIDGRGCVRLADFGIAHISQDNSITKTGSFLGTPGYSAPEQAEGLAATGKTDIFGAGIVFYRCLTGSLPFDGESPHQVLRAILEKDPPNAYALNRRLLPGLPELCARMLAKRPEARPSARECIADLEELGRNLGLAIEPRRLADLLERRDAYVASENAEVTDKYLDLARRLRKAGGMRQALEAYRIAENFSAVPSVAREEAEMLQARLRKAGRRRKWAVSAGALLGLAGFAIWGAFASSQARRPGGDRHFSPPQPETAAPGGRGQRPYSDHPESIAVRLEASVPRSMPAIKPEEPVRESRPGEKRRGLPHNAIPVPPSPAGGDSLKSAQPPVDPPGPRPGYVFIKSMPPFARIFLDGDASGSTPTGSPLELSEGPHDLILEHDGCLPLHASFSVSAEDTAILRFTLQVIGRKKP